MIKIVSLVMCTVIVLAIFPIPKKALLSTEKISVNLCNLNLQHAETNFDPSYYFNKLLNREFGDVRYQCSRTPVVGLILKNEDLPKQAYSIKVTQNLISLSYSTYSGYVYGLETLFQMIDNGYITLGEVYDEPALEHRGIMIDSIRHFLSVKAIKRTIEALPLSKLNVLHWHLSDDESFPFESATHPELYLQGSYDTKSRYSYNDIKEVIAFAKLNAVTVIPQINTPGHVRSWGINQKWKQQNITINCETTQLYNSQFDISKDKAYTLVKDIVRQIDVLFRDSEFIHLGGNEISYECWNTSNVNLFMKLHNLKSFQQLISYWRTQIRKSVSANKKVIYWKDEKNNVITGPDQIIQYTGYQDNLYQSVKSSDSKIILSPRDYLNLGNGQGFANGSLSAGFVSWRDIYLGFNPFPPLINSSRIHGGEAYLEGYVSNQQSLDNNLWMRASVFGQTVWSFERTPLANLVYRIVKLAQQYNKIGIEASPIVPQFCQNYPDKCFPIEKNRKRSIELKI